MDSLQLHVKIAILSAQLQDSHARNRQLYSAARALIDQTKEMREQINTLIEDFPTDTHIEGLVKQCNDVEKRQWLRLVDEAREVIHG